MKPRILKEDVLAFLAGKKKAKLLAYCKQKKSFYQAQVAGDLHWSVSNTQYYLKNFVKYGLLIKNQTSYKTFYEFNRSALKSLF